MGNGRIPPEQERATISATTGFLLRNLAAVPFVAAGVLAPLVSA
jgi:hypothetical protein